MKMMAFRLSVCALILVAAATACSAPEPQPIEPSQEQIEATTPVSKPPAGETQTATPDIQLESLTLSSAEALVGDTVILTVTLSNQGTAKGDYEVVAGLDGAEIGRTSAEVGPGATKEVTFDVTCESGGTHEVRVEQFTATLHVTEPIPPVKEYEELKYDDGGNDFSTSGSGIGYAVRFIPPATPFTVDRVKVYGKTYGGGCEDGEIEIEIRSLDWRLLDFMRCPHSTFGVNTDWVVIEMSGTSVQDEFYVVVSLNSPMECGVKIGTDLDSENLHSATVIDGKIVDTWFNPNANMLKERGNWMIRVESRIVPRQ
jgi:hypothetical protein